MLSDNLRNELIKKIKENPKEALNMIEEDPKILEILLNDSKEVEKEKNEKIKYINMTYEMQARLQEEAKKLNTTQGLLMGAGVLFLLSLLGKKR